MYMYVGMGQVQNACLGIRYRSSSKITSAKQYKVLWTLAEAMNLVSVESLGTDAY